MPKIFQANQENFMWVYSYLLKKARGGELDKTQFNAIMRFSSLPHENEKIAFLNGVIKTLDSDERRHLSVAMANARRRLKVKESVEAEKRIAVKETVHKKLKKLADRQNSTIDETIAELIKHYSLTANHTNMERNLIDSDEKEVRIAIKKTTHDSLRSFAKKRQIFIYQMVAELLDHYCH